MPFSLLDTASVARALATIGGEHDLTEAFFERAEEWELPFEGDRHGLRHRRDEGLAIRLMQGRRQWLASRDAIDGATFSDALRQAARSHPFARIEPVLAMAPAVEDGEAMLSELASFPAAVERALRALHVAFPLRLASRRHRRDLRVVSARLAAPPEREEFASVVAETPWGRTGALFARLDDRAAERLAIRLADRFRGRDAPPPPAGRARVLFAPEATAVLLHEAVAHALEADLLAASGSPEAALGLALGNAQVSILDDPAGAPAGVARRTDDEGVAVVRRWLLREGRVEQPLADLAAARPSERLIAGSGFRADRHAVPLPRSVHLELLPGAETNEGLLSIAERGLWVQEIESGALDPASGEFQIEVAAARRIEHGAPAEPRGAFVLRGRVAEALSGVVAVGRDAVRCDAGWCAKGAQRRAVWATAPALLIEGLEVVS